MTDYTQNTTFTTKDGLTTGDPNKVIYGADLDGEFSEIATAITSKANRPASAATANFAGFADTSGNLADTSKAIPTGTVVGSSDAQTLTNKTVALGSNTVSGTTAQFNTALSDGSFCTLAGTETLTNKTLTSPAINGATINGASTIDGITGTNLLDKSAAETVSGNYTFTGTLDFNDSQTRTVMLTTPEALTVSTEGSWTGVAPSATTGRSDITALIVRFKHRCEFSAGGATSGSPATLTYTLDVRASAGDGEYEVSELYRNFNNSDDDDWNTNTVVATIKADSNGDFDYLISTSIPDYEINSRSITAHLVGYIEKV